MPVGFSIRERVVPRESGVECADVGESVVCEWCMQKWVAERGFGEVLRKLCRIGSLSPPPPLLCQYFEPSAKPPTMPQRARVRSQGSSTAPSKASNAFAIKCLTRHRISVILCEFKKGTHNDDRYAT